MAPYFRFNVPCGITTTTTTTTTILQYVITLYARQITPTISLDFHYSIDGGSSWNFVGTSIGTTCSSVANIFVPAGSSASVRIGSPTVLTTVYSSNRAANSTTCPTWNQGTSACEWPILTTANRNYAFTVDYQNSLAC